MQILPPSKAMSAQSEPPTSSGPDSGPVERKSTGIGDIRSSCPSRGQTLEQNPSVLAQDTLLGLALAPSWINVELNVTEAWQVIGEQASSTLIRYVRFVAPGMGTTSRSQTRVVEATLHGELFALTQVSLEPTVDLPLTDVVKSLPFPIPTLDIHDVPCSANHIAPSVPTAIPAGTAAVLGVENSVMSPLMAIRPIFSP